MNAILNASSLTGQIGAGSLILNDYALNITPIDRGYRITVIRGSEVQTMDVLDGVGIAGIEKTGSTGDVDSYRISFTDGSTFEYTVETNAASNAAAEAARVEAENSREGAEAARASAEAQRASAESARASAEAQRASAESARVAAEAARESAETARANAESERVAAEESRATEFAGFSGEITQLKDDKLDKTGTAANSDKLGGQLPEHYATAQSVNQLEDVIETLGLSVENGRLCVKVERS